MNVIYSTTSSKGNCSVIESKDGHLLIIDAGIKYKTVDKEIGYRLHKADALLITHAHNDHTKYLKEFENIKGIYLPNECLDYFTKRNSIKPIEHLSISTPGFLIMPIEMYHTNNDGTECECWGFLIGDKSSKQKMIWATDTQYIGYKFHPLEFYCIEANYFEQDDYEGELDYIEKSVEQRRFQSHMSFESAVKFLKMQDLSKCKEIRLLHLSSSMDEAKRKNIKKKLRACLKNQLNGKKVDIYA